MQTVAAFVGVDDEHRSAVGIPVGDGDVAGQADVDVDAVAGRDVPDRRSLDTDAFVLQHQPLVAGHRREAHRHEAEARPVPLLADGFAGAAVDDAHREVHRVAVLGVAECDERLVARQRPDVQVLGMMMHARRRTGVVAAGDPHVEAVVTGDPGRDDVTSEGEALRPPVGDAVEKGIRRGTTRCRRRRV